IPGRACVRERIACGQWDEIRACGRVQPSRRTSEGHQEGSEARQEGSEAVKKEAKPSRRRRSHQEGGRSTQEGGAAADQPPAKPPDLGSSRSLLASSSTLTSLNVTTRTDLTNRAGR